MDSNQPNQQTSYAPAAAAPGIFGTKIPSSVAFVVGILLFLMPLSELKCGGSTFAQKSGLDMVMDKDWKSSGGGGFNQNELQTKTVAAGGEKKGQVQIYAAVALALALIGLLLSAAVNSKSGAMGGAVTGVLAAGAMIGLMLEVKKITDQMIAKQALNKAEEGADSFGFDKIGQSMSDNMKITVGFTPWFYIAVIAFLAAAFFCYKRMSAIK